MDFPRKTKKIHFIVIAVFLAASFGGWESAHTFVEPSSTPPNGNVGAPVTIQSPGQTKAGSLTVNTDGVASEGLVVDKGEFEVRDGESSFSNGTYSDPDSGNSYDAKFGGSNRGVAVRGTSVFLGPVGIVDTTPDGTLSLDVDGEIGAQSYCDEDGSNCYTVLELLNGGAGSIDSLSDGVSDETTNVFLGTGAGAGDTTAAYNNTSLGIDALNANASGSSNTALGFRSLYRNTSGSNSVAIGYNALRENLTVSSSTAVGASALRSNTTGYGNVAVGFASLYKTTSGGGNTSVGTASLYENLSGASNTAVGGNTLRDNVTGNRNVAVGENALRLVTQGSDNATLGYRAGYNVTTSNNNTFIGAYAGDDVTSGARNISIGYGSEVANPTASDQLSIGNFIYGTGLNGYDTAISPGRIGLGTKTPEQQLDVSAPGYAGLRVGTSSNSGNNAFIEIEGARTTSTTENISSVRFNNNDAGADYEGARIAIRNSDAVSGTANTDLVVSTNNNTGPQQAMLIDDQGNVAIGPTADPQAKLDVIGDIVSRNGGNEIVRINNTDDFTAEPDIQIFTDGGVAAEGDLNLNIDSDSDEVDRALKINSNGNNASATELARFNEDGTVGIGDATPDGTLKLDVEGQIGATEYCDENGANCVPAGSTAATNFLALTDTPATSTAGSIYFGDGTNVAEDNANLFWDDVNNRLGIGKSAPGVTLDIDGTTAIAGGDFNYFFANTGAGSVQIPYRMKANDGVGNFHVYINTNGGASPIYDSNGFAYHEVYNPADGQYRVQTAVSGTQGTPLTWQDAFTVAGNATVGVGDTTPDGSLKLDVQGQVGATEYCDENGANCTPAGSLSGSDTFLGLTDTPATSTAGSIYFGDGLNVAEDNANLFYDDTNNRLGLGTTLPEARLQLGDGAAQANNYIAFGKRLAASQVNLPFIGQDSVDGVENGIGIGASSSNGGVNFYAGSATAFNPANLRMRIDPDGDVGIGDVTPNTGLKLDVEGRVGATEYCDENGANCVLATNLGADGDAWGVDGEDQASDVERAGFVGIGAQATGGASNSVLNLDHHFALDATTRQVYSNTTATSPPLTADRTTYGAQYNILNNKTESGTNDSDANAVYGFVETNGTNTFRTNRGVSGVSYNNSTAATGLGIPIGVQGNARQLANSGNIGNVYGVYGTAAGDTTAGTTSSVSNLYSVYGFATPYRSSASNVRGVYGLAQTSNTYEGDIDNAYGVVGTVRVDSDDGGDITTGFGGYFSTNRRSTANLMGTAYGVYSNVDDATTAYGAVLLANDADATTNVALQLDGALASGSNYGILGQRGDWVLDEDGDGNVAGTGPGGDLVLGEGQDFRLWHDGVNSYMRNEVGDLYITDNGADNVLLSTNGGDVGIGDTTPDATLKLDVEGQIGATEYCDENGLNCIPAGTLGGATTFLGLTDTPATSTAGSIYFGDGVNVSENNASLFWDNVNNRLGLGTATPERDLDIAGLTPFLRLTSTDTGNHVLDDEFSGIEFYTEDPDHPNQPGVSGYIKSVHTRAGASHAYADAGLTFGTQNSSGAAQERLRITHDGKVGIGDTTPNSSLLLDVEGRVGATEYCDQNGANCRVVTDLSQVQVINDLGDAKTNGNSVFLGDNAGNLDDGANQNTAVGAAAMDAVVSGLYNSAFGYGALTTATGNSNTAVGRLALRYTTTGTNNSALGRDALEQNTTGGSNSALGMQALHSNTEGSSNVGIGRNSMFANTTGIQNVGVGAYVLDANVTGFNNTAVGYAALGASTGTGNVGIGQGTGDQLTAGNYNVAIGYRSQVASSTGSNQLSIGNIIYGTAIDGTGTSISTGNVGIGIKSPSAKLDVAGTSTNATALRLRAGDVASQSDSSQIVMAFNASENYSHAIKTRHNASAVENNAIDLFVWDQGVDAAATVGTKKVATFDARHDGAVGIGTDQPVTNLDVDGGVAFATRTIAAATTITTGDNMILCNAGNVNRTLTLPTAASAPGFEVTVKKINTTAGNCIIDGSGAELIDGAATLTISDSYDAYTVMSDGTSWWVK